MKVAGNFRNSLAVATAPFSGFIRQRCEAAAPQWHGLCLPQAQGQDQYLRFLLGLFWLFCRDMSLYPPFAWPYYPED